MFVPDFEKGFVLGEGKGDFHCPVGWCLFQNQCEEATVSPVP